MNRNIQVIESLFGQPVIIGRLEETEEAIHRVEQMLSGLSVPDCVVFYHGVPSVGKTTLLHEIRRQCAGRGVPSALVDFDREQIADGCSVDGIYDGLSGRVKVAERLMKELARSADFLPDRPINSDLSPDEATERLLDFARGLYQFGHQRPFALFFDTIEDADPEAFLWVQERILEPFLNQFRVLIVMASRTEPNTIRRDLTYPIERRTTKYRLEPFDGGWTDEQLNTLGAQDVALRGADLTRYTGGLPGLNRDAARWLVQKRPVDQLLSHLVDEVIFKRLAHRVPGDLKAEVLAVSALRQFDSGLLRRLTRSLWPAKYAATGMGPTRQLLQRLQQTRLVEPHPDGYGYVVPHDLRVVLDAYWRETQPEQHFRVHQTAARWFTEQIKQSDYVAIADRLYHLGGLWRDVEEHPDLADHLESDLQPEPAVYDRLVYELRMALDALRDHPRAYDLVNKIKNVLRGPEFTHILEPAIIEELITVCERFNSSIH